MKNFLIGLVLIAVAGALLHAIPLYQYTGFVLLIAGMNLLIAGD